MLTILSIGYLNEMSCVPLLFREFLDLWGRFVLPQVLSQKVGGPHGTTRIALRKRLSHRLLCDCGIA